MSKKILVFCLQVLALTLMFSFLYWLMGLLADGTRSFDWTILVQGLVFSLIFIPISNRIYRRRNNPSHEE